MISFLSDYAEGAHPKVLEALVRTNMEQSPGYGTDSYTARAKERILQLARCPQGQVVFIPGGTLTNLIAISHLLASYEAVIAADTGHITCNETGAIEATGHKIISVPSPDGKLTPEQIQGVLDSHGNPPHMVVPRVVYLSQTAETGTHYTLAEMEAISALCRQAGLLLYIDGARLGCAMAAEPNLGLPEYACLTDMFTIGGNKNGTLFGEALVISDPSLAHRIDFTMKQRGGLMSKGRLLGVQFLALLEDNLYVELAAHANQMAVALRDGMERLGYASLYASATNQQYAILSNGLVQALSDRYDLRIWEARETHSVVRFVTSWATKPEDVEAFLTDLERESKLLGGNSHK